VSLLFMPQFWLLAIGLFYPAAPQPVWLLPATAAVLVLLGRGLHLGPMQRAGLLFSARKRVRQAVERAATAASGPTRSWTDVDFSLRTLNRLFTNKNSGGPATQRLFVRNRTG
jgi:hypothetical protein